MKPHFIRFPTEIYSAPSSSGASHLQVGLRRGSNFWAPHIAEVRTTSETSSRSGFEVMIFLEKILPATVAPLLAYMVNVDGNNGKELQIQSAWQVPSVPSKQNQQAGLV